ncbi:histidine phosphatase family protein [Nonomuraea sp. 3N208]|uniref:histidine phosphatase family protein n=1 Tax=Nonomuraea sp. 3N208 TaxID=3457421 RepID=UPI003FD1DC3E
MAALAGEPLARIYASTALRARQTAELLATAPTLDIAGIPELVEVGPTATREVTCAACAAQASQGSRRSGRARCHIGRPRRAASLCHGQG